MKRDRLVIYPKDIQLITGRGERYAQRLVRIMKERLGKEKHQFITIDEFCEFAGLERKDLDQYL